MTFDYLVGVATATDDDVADASVVVDLPGGSDAVFETSVKSVEVDYEAVLTECLPDSGGERRTAPEFER